MFGCTDGLKIDLSMQSVPGRVEINNNLPLMKCREGDQGLESEQS